jgi:hypothetical protein
VQHAADPGNGAAAGRTRKSRNPEDKAMDDDTDLTLLGDPEFLAERRRVREELEHQPEASAELSARYQVLNEEFLRRARIAWTGSDQ